MNFIGAENLPSAIKDPFLKDAVDSISIKYEHKWFGDKEGYWKAYVYFKNGNTAGNQKTEDCETFEDVIIALKQIFSSVK